MTTQRLDLNRPIFIIEQMNNCSAHQWHTRYDENKYNEFTQKLATEITQNIPDAVILCN